MEKATVRNSCLDLIKGVACIFVVFMHSEFPGRFGTLVQCVARFCVPFFFMVSGYFAYYKAPKQPHYAAKLRHIGLITLGACLFYLAVTCVTAGFSWIGQINWRQLNWVKLLVFNEPNFVAGQLWFLFALLYDYLLWALVDRFKLYRVAYLLIPILILVYILLAQGASLAGIWIPNYLYRNFLIEGFPLFMLGHWIHRNQERLRLSTPVLLVIFIASTLLCVPERMLFGRDFGMHLCTFPQVISLFLLGIANPSFGSGSKLTFFGLRFSMFVYILHPFMMNVVHFVYKKLHLLDSAPADWVCPVLVLVGAVILSAVVLWLKGKLSLIFNQKQEQL